MNAREIAGKLDSTKRAIILRTPLQHPAPAYLIATESIGSGTVAALGRSHAELFVRFQADDSKRVEYRLSPLGLEVRAILLEEQGRTETGKDIRS